MTDYNIPSDDDYHLYMSSSPSFRDYLLVVAFVMVWVDGHQNRERHLTTLRDLTIRELRSERWFW